MAGKYNFDKIIERHGTDCLKYDTTQQVFGRSDILPLWIADMDFESPPEVMEAVQKRSNCGVYGYTFRTDEAQQIFVDWVDRIHGWKIQKHWMLSSPGVVCALSLGVKLLTQPGDKVLILTPVYPPFFEVVKGNGRQLVTSQLVEGEKGYEIDWDDFEAKLKSGVKLMIHCNPHNPVGRQWTADELRKIGDLCIKYGAKVISDEIHCDLALFGNKHTVMASLSDEIAANTVTAMAPSKTFNIAGLSNSVIVISDDAMRELFHKELMVLHLCGGNIFGHVALKAAYREGEPWREEMLRYIESNIEMSIEFFAEEMPEVKLYKPECSFLLWLDFRGTGLSHEEVGDKLINKGLVGLNDGADFGPGGVGFRRMNIGSPALVISDGLERIWKSFNR